MNNDHIPTEEVKQDMADTREEIHNMEREERAFRLLGDRMSMFKADARNTGIRQRREFLAKLGLVLETRVKKGLEKSDG